MAKCSGLKVTQNQIFSCYQGGNCYPSTIDLRDLDLNKGLAIELSKLGNLAIPKQVTNVDLLPCQSSMQKGESEFYKCASQRVMTDDQKKVLECYTSNESSFLKCVSSRSLDSDQYALAHCIIDASGNSEIIQDCALGNVASEDTKKVISCISSGDMDEVSNCLASNFVGEDARTALGCIDKHGDDLEANAACMAEGMLDDEQAKIVKCATNTDGWASFAVCSAGDKLGLNPEQLIAAECAASTGGDPISFATCSGTRLTVRELTKCFTHGIGGDGCFGPNNTIVKHYRNMITDVTQGPGKGNEIVKLREAILGEDNGEIARFLRDPGKRTIEAAENVSKEVGKLSGGHGSEFNKAHRALKKAVNDLERSDLNPANWGRFRW